MKKTPEPMNLRKLRPSRKAPRPGDIFVLQPKGHPYYFGRIITTDASSQGTRTGYRSILIYIYKAHSKSKHQIPPLDKRKLLIPLTFINRLPWSRGYFETVTNLPLTPTDVHKVHCFQEIRRPPKYFDEFANPLPRRTTPCAYLGLSSYSYVDDLVSEGLGIPLATDT
jgi:hypothetical protein